MKFLLLCACLFVATNALEKDFVEKFIQLIKEIGKTCVEETHATDDDVAKLLSHQIPNTQEGQCMLFCFHKAFNIQNADGSLNPDGALQSLEPLKAADADVYEKAVAVFTKCIESSKVDADPCVTAANLAKCGMTEGEAMGLKENMFKI